MIGSYCYLLADRYDAIIRSKGPFCNMPSVTIRNLPDEVHRAIRLRAAQHGRSVEAELRDILQSAVAPQGRVKLGSKLAEIGRMLSLTDEDLAVLDSTRDHSPARAVRFE